MGIGHSSPVVRGDRAWQFARRGDREVLQALELETGRILWSAGHDVPYTMHPAARGHGKGPKSTPVLAAGRLVTLGIAGALTAWDADGGEVLWRHDFADRYESTSPVYGASMSPIVLGDRVVAHVGGHRDGSLAAFDLESGRRQWSLDGDGPGYASPVPFRVDGVDQLVTQTDAHVIGVDPEDGDLLWSLPMRTDYDQNVVTPLAVGSRLILSGLNHGVFAVRPERDDEGWSARELWRNEEVSLYMSSPVHAAGRVFGMSHLRAGQFFALDPEDGSVLWRSRGREGDNAAVVAVDGRVLFLTDDARLIVAEAAADEYEPLTEHEVADSATWAHPVPTTRGLLVKDLEGLTLWDLGSPDACRRGRLRRCSS
ncbi:MAG: PQQ-binding-like beta-propeller repeat protein [Acidobacteriota bacterium]